MLLTASKCWSSPAGKGGEGAAAAAAAAAIAAAAEGEEGSDNRGRGPDPQLVAKVYGERGPL